MQRIYPSQQHFQPGEHEPVRSVVAESEHCVVVAWLVKPGQRIALHTHPHGQDTWTVLSGQGQYGVDGEGHTVPIAAGDIAIARRGQVHGVLATGSEPLTFVSVVAPLEAGFAPHPLSA